MTYTTKPDDPTEKDLAEMFLQFAQWEREDALQTLIKLSKMEKDNGNTTPSPEGSGIRRDTGWNPLSHLLPRD